MITGAVEGIVDEAVLRRLVESAGMEVASVYIANGKPGLLDRLDGFNAAARFAPWLVLVDLDGDAACAPEFASELLATPSTGMLLRIAHRQIESWLLADRQALARFMKVSIDLVPSDPELLPNAKDMVVQLARRSRDRAIREEMVPAPGSGRNTGRGYAGNLIEFVVTAWDPERAATNADSLERARRAMLAAKRAG